MEAHRGGPRKALCERAQPRERLRGPILVEVADRHRRQRLGIVRRQRGGALELATGGERPAEPLQRGAEEQGVADAAVLGPPAQERVLLGRAQPLQRGR